MTRIIGRTIPIARSTMEMRDSRCFDAVGYLRMAMIEKGLNAADLKGISIGEFFKSSPLNNLKWGLLTMFVGIGLVVAILLDQIFMLEEPLYFGSMRIFGGLALVQFYLMASKKQSE